MKIIEKISLIVFANIVLILSLLLLVIMFGWLDLSVLTDAINIGLTGPAISKVVLGVLIVLILLAIRCIFFDAYAEDSKMNGAAEITTDNGNLVISRETIESLIATVVSSFEGAEDVSSKVNFDKENNVNIELTIFVHPDAIIKDLSTNLQTKVKEAIKTSSGLEVKEVNIKVKNIAQEKVSIEE